MSNGEAGGAPRRSGPAWWVWALGGCGGCLLLVLIGVGVLGYMGKRAWDSVDVGPVTAATVQAKLGPSVPVYPGAQLEIQATEIALRSLGMMTNLVPGMSKEVKFTATGVYKTGDPASKVWTFYDDKLPALGWQRAQSQTMGINQQKQNTYKKQREFLTVQTQEPGGQGTVLTLMKGEGDSMTKGSVKVN